MAVAQVEQQVQVRRWTASNVQNALWRRQSLREAFAAHTAYTAVEKCEHGALHLFAVPTTDRLGYTFVTWNCQDDEFSCSKHRMHACACSGAAMLALMARGLLPYMSSHEPEEVETNARVWREATA